MNGPSGRRASASFVMMLRVRDGRIVRIGPGSGPSIALRGELDALPVREETNVAWSAVNGAMHACGHDVHLAALVAVARAARSLPLPGALLAVLQPSEETFPSGARTMLDVGAFDDHDVRAFRQRTNDSLALGVAQVHRDGFLVARLRVPPERIALVQLAPLAQGIAFPRRFDLDHLGAELREQAGTIGPRDESSHLDHLHACKRSLRHAILSR